jgi:acyl dehydratase
MDPLHFEDFAPGETLEFGDYEVTAAEIVEFAREFDPQIFHLDAAAARDTFPGGLIASGWHTASILMRMLCDGLLSRSTSQGGPGVDELEWTRPVRPGDRLRARGAVLSARALRSRPTLGLVAFEFEVFNQNAEVVMRQKNSIFFLRRSAGEASS